MSVANETMDNSFGLSISIINRMAQSYFTHRLRDFNIGPGQQAYLLSVLPGEEIVQDELARRLKVDKANVTRALTGLEAAGYICRKRSQSDKRSWLISLTDNGGHIREEIEVISRDWISTLRKCLSREEWECAQAGLKKIADSLHHDSPFIMTALSS